MHFRGEMIGINAWKSMREELARHAHLYFCSSHQPVS